MYKKYQAFCGNCYEDVDYYIQDSNESVEISGKNYEYPVKTAYCTHCHNIASHRAILDYNVDSINKQCRTENHIISLAEIRKITSIYNIGVGPLSKLLKQDDLYFKEYFAGQEPIYEKSQKLLRIRYEPQYFLEILEANKEQISPIAYEKAKYAAQLLLSESFQSKLYYACLYFINKKRVLNKFVLQKLLYYTQGFSRIIFKYPLFTEECLAWQYGPVFDLAYNAFKNRSSKLDTFNFKKFQDEIPDSFSDIFLDQEIELLDTIARCFGDFEKEELIEFTHSEKPWIEAYQTESKLISKDAFYEFFINLQIEHGIFKCRDISNYVEYLVAKTQGKNIPQTGLIVDPLTLKE